jgi:asparagine synthase (glutamine-hydrolysing)
MARNFCGFINLEENQNSDIAMKMANKLNINDLYSSRIHSYANAHLVNLYSQNFPEKHYSVFMNEMKTRYSIASFSILIHKEELINKLGCNVLPLMISEEELILRSFLKWGKNNTKYLEGDWSFVIWDNYEKEAFIAVNQHADGTLFFYQSGNKLFFSSLLTGLVGIDEIPNEVDKEKYFFENLRTSGIKFKTLYKDINFLPGGYQIRFSRNSFKLEQYWNLKSIAKVRWKNEKDYIEAFYESFNRAVCSRLDITSNWKAAMSGGLDSAATMALASNYFKEKKENLSALTYIPFDSSFNKYNSLNHYGDEKELATETANYCGNINLSFVTRDDKFLRYMLSYTKDFGTPPHIPNIWYVDKLSEQFSLSGSGLVMTAQGGNTCLTYVGIPTQSNLSQYLNDLQDGLNVDLKTHVMLVLTSTLRNLNTFIKDTKKDRRRRIKSLIQNKTFLKPEFVESIDGYALLEDYLYRYDPEKSPSENMFLKKLRPGETSRLGLWNKIGTRHDIAFVDPTRDKDFLELVYSFPNYLFNKNGEQKYIYKKTFNELVSPKVMNNKKRGYNLSDIISLYQADLDTFKDLLEAKNDTYIYRSMVDMDKIREIYFLLKNEKNFNENFVHSLSTKSNSIFHALMM